VTLSRGNSVISRSDYCNAKCHRTLRPSASPQSVRALRRAMRLYCNTSSVYDAFRPTRLISTPVARRVERARTGVTGPHARWQTWRLTEVQLATRGRSCIEEGKVLVVDVSMMSATMPTCYIRACVWSGMQGCHGDIRPVTCVWFRLA